MWIAAGCGCWMVEVCWLSQHCIPYFLTEAHHGGGTEVTVEYQLELPEFNENMRHQSNRILYVYYGLEPSADSFWQQPNTVVVHVNHRNVQLAQS